MVRNIGHLAIEVTLPGCRPKTSPARTSSLGLTIPLTIGLPLPRRFTTIKSYKFDQFNYAITIEYRERITTNTWRMDKNS